jgi:serine/threonine protein kinase
MDNLVGKTLLNRYFLREQVGVGGMATIYLAWDKLRNAKMALKVLHSEMARSGENFRMFIQEAEMLRKLEHPNIVRLYEFNREGNVAFLVMEWIDGKNLRQVISERNQPYSLEEISHILQPICSALHYAHQNNIFHCDVKPGNIMLHVDGRVFLGDFGVARLANERMRGGTLPYMAPELFAGATINSRTDIYSLGVTLYEMLSGGNVPFTGTTSNSRGKDTRERIAWEHVNLAPPALTRINKTVPQAVENVVLQALAKVPSQRYNTTMSMLEAFEKARSLPSTGAQLANTQTRGTSPPTIVQPHQPEQIGQRFVPPTPSPASGSAVSIKAPCLVGRGGEINDSIVPLTTQGLSIGRSSTCTLRLNERSISRQHATIIHTRRGFYLRDEGSTLGTFVNNQRIPPGAPVILKQGDMIQIGYYQLFEVRLK